MDESASFTKHLSVLLGESFCSPGIFTFDALLKLGHYLILWFKLKG